MTSRTWRVPGLKGVLFSSDHGRPSFDHHIHDDFSLDVVESGVMESYAGNRRILVRTGNLLLLPPFELHRAKSIGRQQLVLKSICLPEALFTQIASEESIRSSAHPAWPVVVSDPISSKFSMVHQIAERQPAGLDVETRLLDAIASLLGFNHRNSPSGEYKAVKMVQEYLVAHYDQNVSLQELADLVQLSRFYLVRLFKSHMGISPYNYLTHVRIARAATLLHEGMPAADVAVAVGLCDQSHLIRLFKRIRGKTPATYARILKN